MYQTGQSGRRIHDRCSRLLDARTVPSCFRRGRIQDGKPIDRRIGPTTRHCWTLRGRSHAWRAPSRRLRALPMTPPGLPRDCPQARGGSPSPARVSREGISAADPGSGLDRCFLSLPWRILLQGRGGARLVYLRPFLNNTLGLWPEHPVRHRV